MSTAVELHVEEYGAGEPAIVLLHGFAGSARNFRPQARFLGSRYRVVLFDARGHARSAAPEDDREYEPDAFVDDVRRVLDRAGARRVVLGGISMGAAVALRYALLYGSSLSGLLLISFPPSGNQSPTSWALALADAIDRDGPERAGEDLVWGGSRFDAESAKWIRQGFLEHRPHALSAILRKVVATQPALAELAPSLRELTVPTLIVAGENDAPSVAMSLDLERHLPASRRVIIRGAGHVVNLEKPESFNSALGDFLSEIEERK